MRQIKFRAWNGQRMFYPGDGYTDTVMFDYDKVTGQNEVWKVGEGSWDSEVNGAGWHIWRTDAQSEFLMQFTGLLDSKGKEIYEGDVLEFADMHNGTGVIEFVGNGYWVTGNDGKLHLPTTRKVIGNIYENPELIPL